MLGESGRLALKTVFSRLARFPNLRSLCLDFPNPNHDHDFTTPFPFSLLQAFLFDALVENPPPSLVSLTLHDILAVAIDHLPEQEGFHRIFQPLQKLDFSALPNPMIMYRNRPIEPFWNVTIPRILCGAAALTTLALHDQPRLKDIFLPRLASLSLHYFDFGPLKPEADVVEFILRHNALLTRLELHKCSIDCSERGEVPRPWHAVLAVFEAKLHSLREFVYESRPSPRHSLFEYTQFAPGWGLVSFSPWNGEVAGVHRDLSALESLQAVLQSRRGSKGGREPFP
ncbi:hypothetical protein DFH06DRAFT_565345 [Mycena polygramma]|nr:hypothetical protein DFH06DRAFT_565345 [Mycena polygramma]